MRHVIGIACAIGLAAAIFFAASWGYLHLLSVPVVNGGASTLPAHGGTLVHNTTLLAAFGLLAATGLLAGIFIAVRQISPLAAGLPGLALIAWTGVYWWSVRRGVHYIPLRGDVFGHGFEAMLMNGVLGLVGLALIVPLFIPSRWRTLRPGYRPISVLAGSEERTQVIEPTTVSLLGNDEYPPVTPFQEST